MQRGTLSLRLPPPISALEAHADRIMMAARRIYLQIGYESSGVEGESG